MKQLALSVLAATCVTGSLQGRTTIFLTRHGDDHRVQPHLVNYRANIAAMKSLGVIEILAINVVGGLGLKSMELVANPATGLGGTPRTIDVINVVIEQGLQTVRRILSRAAKLLTVTLPAESSRT